MMKGIGLQELAARIAANAEMKRDYIVPTEQLTMMVDSDKTTLMELPDHGRFPILPLAHDQIGGRTQIPAKYYDRMLKDAPELLAANVNTWHRQNPHKRMVRTLGGDMRSLLSNKYQRIENDDIAKVAFPVLAELPNVQVVSAEITERRMYVHFVVPTVEGEVKKGDVVQAGGIISNSEVGCGSVSVAHLIWRLWCLNGMKTGETLRRAHVGREIEDTEQLWADDTRQAEDRSILLKVRDMVRAAVDQARFQATLDKMRGLVDARVTGDPVRVVEVLSSRIGASEVESGGILRALIEGGDLSAWGLLNAVTAQSHTARSYDRAVELEAVGGGLVELAPSEWRRVLEAA